MKAERRSLKKVLLIGDSIRMGYQKTVENELRDIGAVRSPKQNCYDSTAVLSHLDEWVLLRKPGLVHINCGLHDVKRDKETSDINTPVGIYRSNVERILISILGQTEAQVIWATTTPVIEKWHNNCKDFNRFTDDITEYNAAALAVCRDVGVEVNDLHGFVVSTGIETLMAPDGVHYTDEASRQIGVHVARVIRSRLT
jgi:lysophospholipase L1-like esterase